jgi:hypothetical protein
MKSAILCLFMSTGLVFAHHHSNKVTTKLSGDEKVALATSSPRVHYARKHDMDQKRVDPVVANKTTINAYVPAGK